MRIGIMAPPWAPVPPTGYGGTEAVVDRLARGLVAAGHEVLLWTTGDSTCPVPRGWVLEASEGDRIGFAAIELRHLVRGYDALVGWGADLVHDHTLIGPVYARRFPDLPVVTTNHGPFGEELTELYRAIGDRVPIIAVSHDQASRADGLHVAAVIHHGIDLEDHAPGSGAGDDRGEYFLFLGRMAPEKGAFRAALAARKAGVRLLMAAKMREKWEREYFQARVEPLLDEDVVYLGEVSREEKLGLLGGARALVNPIRWPEPFGLVMIEALACGTPVLAYREGAAPEIVDHGVTGFLCDGVDELVERLHQVGELDRHACREAVEARFSTARMVVDHVALYERVLAGAPGRAR
ncbi:MAG: glycosyltransferase family 4 protein [Acidimicrobiia bacterium]|nr:glycosyltransferase family 4 protein [Acidimicrobiia bacterium]